MATLTKILSDVAAEAFRAEGLDPAHGHVTTSDRPDLAQFQCNGALAAAKAAKANPRAIAFYHRHGFRLYGIEPESIKHEGGFLDEALMWRVL